MGLELVEISLSVEEEFGVTLTGFSRFPETVGELHAAIRTELQQKSQIAANWCPSIAAFFLVRDALQQTWSLSQRLRPTTRIEALLPHKQRRHAWEKLGVQLAATLPPLRTDPRFEGPIVLAWLVACVFTLLSGILLADTEGFVIAALTGVPLVSFLVYFILRKMPAIVPADCSTVGDLVCRILPSHQAVTAGSRTDEYNWHRLLNIISDQLDVPLNEIRPESHFVRDLKCD